MLSREPALSLVHLSKEVPMPQDPVNDPSSSAVKSGLRSTEAWITLIVAIIGAVLASGLLDPSDPTQGAIMKIGGLVMTIAASLGYTAARTSAKNRAVEGAAAVAIAKIAAGAPVPIQPSEPK